MAGYNDAVRGKAVGKAAVQASLDMPVQYVKGVGPALASTLAKLGISTAEDLLFYFPRDYQDRTRIRQIAELADGEVATLVARVSGVETYTARS
ncbi:MAG: hypothetical protein ACUVRO_13500, partial [Armatimonadota bacterium]